MGYRGAVGTELEFVMELELIILWYLVLVSSLNPSASDSPLAWFGSPSCQEVYLPSRDLFFPFLFF